MFCDHKIIDCHIHYSLPIEPAELMDVMDRSGTDMANLVLVPHRQRLSSVPDALMAKHMYPQRLFVFTSLDTSGYFRSPKTLGRHMAAYCADMLRCGCDGVKIIEGKPQMRKMLPVPDFDQPVWDPFFAWAEENRVPILWHVNDPEEFWDEARIPGWAKERGWAYDDTYSEVTANEDDRFFLSNWKAFIDTVQYALAYALIPVFVGMSINIRTIGLALAPLCLTMVLAFVLLKEHSTRPQDREGLPAEEKTAAEEDVPLMESIRLTWQNKDFMA